MNTLACFGSDDWLVSVGAFTKSTALVLGEIEIEGDRDLFFYLLYLAYSHHPPYLSLYLMKRREDRHQTEHVFITVFHHASSPACQCFG